MSSPKSSERLVKLGNLLAATDFIEAEHNTVQNIIDGSCSNLDYIRSNIFDASLQILNGVPIQGELKEFIGQALFNIGFNKEDPNFAFKLKSKYKRKAHKPKEVKIAIFTLWLIEAHNLTVKEACKRTGDRKEVCLSQEQVEKIFYKHKKTIENQLFNTSS